MDEEGRSKPHPGLNCQEPDVNAHGCKSGTTPEVLAAVVFRCQMTTDKDTDT